MVLPALVASRNVERAFRLVVTVATAAAVAMALSVLLFAVPLPDRPNPDGAAVAGMRSGGRPFAAEPFEGRRSGRSKHFVNSSVSVAADRKDLAPVVLIPGTGGTQLEARLTKDYKPGSFWCWSFSSKYFRLWLDVFSLIPPFTACFAERLQLVYNEETEKFENQRGVETRVPYWGCTDGIEVLDPTWRSLASYMGPLVTSLRDEGYVVGETLFGAPYDFRYAPGPHAADVAIQYEKDLKDLIEQAYTQNSNKSVVLVAHSLGGLWTLYVINRQPLSWRKQFIKSFVSIATPFGGTVQEMLTFASGYTEGFSLLDPLVLRAEQRSSESNLWLLPVPKVFGSQPLVFTNNRMYSAADMEDFLRDIGYPEGVQAYNSRIPYLFSNMTAPGVPVSIIYGHRVKTPERLYYDNGFDQQPAIMEGDGDGTVNHDSLAAVVEEWKAADGQQVRDFKVAECSHTSIIMESDPLRTIVQEVLHDWTSADTL